MKPFLFLQLQRIKSVNLEHIANHLKKQTTSKKRLQTKAGFPKTFFYGNPALGIIFDHNLSKVSKQPSFI